MRTIRWLTLAAVLLAAATPFPPNAKASLYEVTLTHYSTTFGVCGGLLATFSDPMLAVLESPLPLPNRGDGMGRVWATAFSGLVSARAGYWINTNCCISNGNTAIMGGCAKATLTLDDVIISGPDPTIVTSFNVLIEGGGYDEFHPLNCGDIGLGAGHDAQVSLSFSGTKVRHYQGPTYVSLQSPERTVSTGVPVSLTISLELSGFAKAVKSFDDCDQTYASFAGIYDVHFPVGAPVFNLPPGYTANSEDGRIVDNMYGGGTVAVESGPDSERTLLRQAIPNPFTSSTTITFDLPRAGVVELSIFDVSGKRVRRLLGRHHAAGSHSVQWDGRDDGGAVVPSGVYFYRLHAGSEVGARKVIYRGH